MAFLLTTYNKLRKVSGVSVQASARPPAKQTAGLIKEKKLMNVEHRTSNIERRIMHSIYFKTTERSDSIICQSTLVIRHSPKFHKSARPLVAGVQSDRKRNCAKSTQLPMNSVAVSSSSSKLLSLYVSSTRTSTSTRTI